jgi:chaperone BCS1
MDSFLGARLSPFGGSSLQEEIKYAGFRKIMEYYENSKFRKTSQYGYAVGVAGLMLAANYDKIWRYTKPLAISAYEVTKAQLTGRDEQVRDVRRITRTMLINDFHDMLHWYLTAHSLTDTSPKDRRHMDLEIAKTELAQNLSKDRLSELLTEVVPPGVDSYVLFEDHRIHYKFSDEMVEISGATKEERKNLIVTMRVITDDPTLLVRFGQHVCKEYKKFSKSLTHQQRVYINKGSENARRRHNADAHGGGIAGNAADWGASSRSTSSGSGGRAEWTSRLFDVKKSPESVILHGNDTERIMRDVRDFISPEREQWYLDKGQPYTRRYLFHGKPGTGKSSMINAIVSMTGRDAYYLMLSSVSSDAELVELMKPIDFRKSILIIEDIDCASDAVLSREDDAIGVRAEPGARAEPGMEPASTLTLAGILNVFGGNLTSDHGQIMIMSSNYPERLDPALLRPGRCDMTVEFRLCDKDHALRIAEFLYDERAPARYYTDAYVLRGEPSPAEITQKLVMYLSDRDRVYEDIFMKNEA